MHVCVGGGCMCVWGVGACVCGGWVHVCVGGGCMCVEVCGGGCVGRNTLNTTFSISQHTRPQEAILDYN